MRKKSLALLLALVMLLSLAVPSAMAEEPEEAAGQEEILVGVVETDARDALAQVGVSTYSTGTPGLANGNYQEWIDRIDGIKTSSYYFAYAFYLALEAAAADSGSWLVNPKHDDADGAIEVTPFEEYELSVGSSKYTVAVTDSRAYKINVGNTNLSEAADYISAAYAAFDRDHPEVFWLDGASRCMMTSDGTNNYVYFMLTEEATRTEVGVQGAIPQDYNFDIRKDDYQNASKIENMIISRNEAVQEILEDSVTVEGEELRYDPAGSNYDNVRYFNAWLTHNNAYNSDIGSAGGDAWECVSALLGRWGAEGPVCEGYARAFMVLCDEADINCVLVDGEATNSSNRPEAHMWNYVQMDDGKWYAVDVTWNDPTGGSASGPVSTHERELYLAVGKNTETGNGTFLETHPVSNQVTQNGLEFINGPRLESDSYTPPQKITGSVTISGIAKFGETLTATVEGAPAGASLIYQWYRGNTAIDTMGNTYALTAADVGETIQVKVTALGYTGSLTATAGPVKKADGPAAPTGVEVESVTYDSITVTANSTWEYTLDPTGTWQDSNTFRGLSSDTDYTIYVRVKETATHNASGDVSVSARTAMNPVFGSASVKVSAPETGVALAGDSNCQFFLDGSDSYAESYIDTKEVEWYVGDQKVDYTTAQPNTVYTVRITITLKEGYTFRLSPDVVFNNSTVGVSSSVSDDGKTLTIDYSFPATAEREIDTLSFTATPNPVAVPKKGETATVTLTATATYDDGSSGTVNATWNLPDAHTGVTLSGKTITIAPEAGTYGENIKFTVNASYNGQWDQVEITLSKENAQATTIDISGPETLAIPASDTGTSTGEYTAKVYDQYGAVMEDAEVTWTISGVDGVTVNEGTGVVTVPAGTESGTATLTAACGSASKTFEIRLIKKKDAKVTITGVPEEVVESSNFFNLNAQIQGSSDPNYNMISWSSSDENVLAIQNNGTEKVDGSLQAFAGIAVEGPGTATITVTYEDDTYYGSASVTITVLKQPTLSDFTFTLPSNAVYNGQERPVDVAVKSGITGMGSYQVLYNDSETVPVDAGTYRVTLQVAKGTLYTAATFDLGSFTIDKANQATLTINSVGTVTYGTPVELTASGGSGTGEVTFTVTDGTGKATVSGSTLTPVQAGTVTVTATKAGDNNYNPVTSAPVTITIEKANYTGTTAATGSAKYGNSGTVDLSGLIVPGGTATVGTVTDNEGILTDTPTVSGNVLTFALVNNKDNVGKTVAIPVTVTSDNYEDYTITVTVTVNDKNTDTTTMKVSLKGWTYGDAANTPSVSGVSGGTAVYSYSGTGSTTYGPSATVPTAAGTYRVTATYENDDTIYTATADFTIAKADPVIGTVSVSTPATIFTSTDPEAVTLSWTNTAITGTLKLADGTQFTSGTKSYTWVFSPTDTANYNSVQGTIRLSVTANALQSIAVTTQPTKTAYQYGEAFDPAGMAVTATYADGSSKTVDNGRLTVRYASGSGFNAGDTSVTLSYTEDGVTKTCAVTGLTVSKIAYPGTTSAAGSAKYGSSGTVNLSAMIAPGGTLGTPAVTSGSDILSGTPTLSGGVLTFAFKDDADNVNQDAVITIPVTGAANYNDYTITVTVTVTDKLTPTVTVKDITVTYTGSPVPASAIRGTATYGGETVKGTWSWYGKSPTNVAESDLYLVCFTPEDSDTYATVVELVNVTINKATPTGTPKYTAVTEDGKTLEDVALSASGFSVPGTVKWVDDEDTLVRANTAYQWTFTPADRANYNVVSGKLTPYRVYDDDDDTPVEGSIVSAPAASHGSVRVDTGRAEKGDTVTITAIPDEGYVLESIVVTDRYGDTVRLTNEGDGVFSFTMPGSAITVKTVFVPEGSATVSQEMDFADVGESHWAYNEIAWAFENGYMNGTGTATFHPTGSVTRQQVWMILARMSGADPANMAEAKNWAVNNGVSDGSNPGSPVTRQQLVALLYRFAGQMGYDTAARADLSGYPDAASVSSYAADAMAWSVANSIVGGTTAGTLNPTGTANRAQFAAILWRFYQSSQS